MRSARQTQPRVRCRDCHSRRRRSGWAGAAYSVISRELKLKIVGPSPISIPEHARANSRSSVSSTQAADSLHVMQPTDFCGSKYRVRLEASVLFGQRASENPAQNTSDSRMQLRRWDSTLSPSSTATPAVLPQFLPPVLDRGSWEFFRQPRPRCRLHRNRKHSW